jgi:protein-L-isoaspartate(D-aspartate) O-methyltransferase
MTDLGNITRSDVVFETGTGAGYHTAVLAALARRVVSVEVIAPLALKASATLKRLGYANAAVHLGDGYYGWKSGAPYDVMIVKEAVGHIPPPLLRQLKPGGRLVIPIGPRDADQQLTLVEKSREGKLREWNILPVRFTPMQGGERI